MPLARQNKSSHFDVVILQNIERELEVNVTVMAVWDTVVFVFFAVLLCFTLTHPPLKINISQKTVAKCSALLGGKIIKPEKQCKSVPNVLY